ncbi:MAG: PIG-L deacetylase family protein [Egibacteraceae bacterium]
MVTEGGSVLAVMAHPDDAELWAGGTLALHACGAAVTVALERAEPVRMREAADGARVLGVTLRVLDELTPDALTALLVELRPQVVVTHHVDDVHPDHHRTAQCVLAAVPRAVIDCGHPRRLYTCDTYESLTLHGHIAGRTIVDISSTFATKMQALAMHASQPLDHFAAMAERLARCWGARIGATHAEAFDPLPVLGRLPATRYL